MKKMQVTKTLFTNKIKYAYIKVEGGTPATKQAELTVYSGEAVSEEKAKKILRSHVSEATYLGVLASSATYSMAADKFIATAEVVNE